MEKLSCFLMSMFVSFFVLAKEDPKYPVSAIPEDMKTGMYAVVREQELTFKINSVSNTNMYHRIVITILNPNAKGCASKVIGYDKFRVIKSFKGIVYDASGSIIRKLKSSEIYDQSAFDGYSLYSDNRLKAADLAQGTYPYTVEFEYEIETKYLYSLPDFYLYTDDEISIQKTKYSILYANGLKPRFKLFKIEEPKTGKINGMESLDWSFENIKPGKFEKLSPDIHKVVPNICSAPVAFEFHGYPGRMDSWKDLGKWQTLLNEGRGTLPEATKIRIHELTKNAKTIEEKSRILYEYLQNKTRYVSIQLGIGGLQPFEAKVVDQTGYGDCKALSNYMVSLLKEVGVTGYYTTIMAGDDALAVDPTFPNDQSNHIIVAVPNLKDTTLARMYKSNESIWVSGKLHR